jgi:hypothetical protein
MPLKEKAKDKRTTPMMTSSGTNLPLSMKSLAVFPTSVPAATAARSISPVERWTLRITIITILILRGVKKSGQEKIQETCCTYHSKFLFDHFTLCALSTSRRSGNDKVDGKELRVPSRRQHSPVTCWPVNRCHRPSRLKWADKGESRHWEQQEDRDNLIHGGLYSKVGVVGYKEKEQL